MHPGKCSQQSIWIYAWRTLNTRFEVNGSGRTEAVHCSGKRQRIAVGAAGNGKDSAVCAVHNKGLGLGIVAER